MSTPIETFAGALAAADGKRETETFGQYDRRRARAALASLAQHRDDIVEVLTEHRPHPVSSPHCACGWRPAIFLNDTESDRRQHRAHQADAVLAYLTGAQR